MKISIWWDEEYPVYGFECGNYMDAVEVSEETVDNWKRIQVEYAAMQQELAKLRAEAENAQQTESA